MLTDGFVRQAESQPTARALGYDGLSLDYAALCARANAVGRLLATYDVGPDDRVALVLPKTHDAVIALLGILLAGAAYVPVQLATAARTHLSHTRQLQREGPRDNGTIAGLNACR